MKSTTDEQAEDGGGEFISCEAKEQGERLCAASLDKLVDLCAEEFGKVVVARYSVYLRFKVIIVCKFIVYFHTWLCIQS